MDALSVQRGRRGASRRGLTIVAAALALVGLLALATSGRGPVTELDADIASWVAGEMPAWAEWTARPFTWLGGVVGTGIVTLAGATVLARRGRRRDALLLTVAYLGAQLSSAVVKAVTDRPRPSFEAPIAVPDSSAFPSGHATGAAAVLLLAAVLLAPAARRTALVALACALAVAVGASRVVLGVHWTSDVVAGWALGLAWVGLCLLLRRRR